MRSLPFTSGRLAAPGRPVAGRHGYWPIVVIAVVGAVLPTVLTSQYDVGVLTEIAIFAIVAYGLDILLGQLGLVSVAHAALLMASAYTLAALTVYQHMNYWLAAVCAVCLTGIVGLLFAAITMRCRGHYFAVSSLAFAGVAVVVLTQWTSVTQGASGIYAIPSPPGFDTSTKLYYLSLAVMVAVGLGMFALQRSSLGESMRAIRTDEMLAASLGIPVMTRKLYGFVISAVIAGVAGPLFASWVTYITPDGADITTGFNFLTYIIIGGSATLTGPVTGTALVVGVSEALRFTNLYQTLIFSAVVFVVLVFFRGGLAGTADVARRIVAKLRPSGSAAEVGGERRAGVAAPPIESYPARAFADSELTADPRGSGDVGPVYQGRGLTKRFGGVVAVDSVSVDLYPGEICGIIGPNGAGKSTLLGLMSGVVRAFSGRSLLGGTDVAGKRSDQLAGLGVARTFQTNRLLSGRTVLENLEVASYGTRRISRPGGVGDSDGARPPEGGSLALDHSQILGLVGLGDQAGRVVDKLSLEERKLVAVAMALACGPRVLLLDEPFAGLRASETPRLVAVLRRLRSRGLAIALVEHKMRVIMSLCSYIYVLDSGELIAEGTPDEVSSDPKVVAAYLGGEYVRAGS